MEPTAADFDDSGVDCYSFGDYCFPFCWSVQISSCLIQRRKVFEILIHGQSIASQKKSSGSDLRLTDTENRQSLGTRTLEQLSTKNRFFRCLLWVILERIRSEYNRPSCFAGVLEVMRTCEGIFIR